MSQTPGHFEYEAQTYDGQPLSGTIEATDAEDARRQLEGIGLRPVNIEQVEAAPKPKRLSVDDLMTFNQQLAQLTGAGMPIEHGLRLIAQDVRSHRLRATIEQLVQQLESGRSLDDAFDELRDQFPPLYGRVAEAGIRSGRLPGVLLNVGRHLELMQRLRAVVWRALSYPMIIILGTLGVLLFVSLYIVPQFKPIFEDFDTELPKLTQMIFTLADSVPPLLIALLAVAVFLPMLVRLAQRTSAGRNVIEQLLLTIPLLSGVIARNLAARWCDAMYLGLDAGIDLTASLNLAGDVVHSPALQRDCRRLADTIEQGQPLDQTPRLSVLPRAVPAAIELGSRSNDLPNTLVSLGQMYQNEAQWRINTVQAVLPPFLLLFVALSLGFVAVALILPLIKLITELT